MRAPSDPLPSRLSMQRSPTYVPSLQAMPMTRSGRSNRWAMRRVIGLAGKHEGARLEAACARAIEAGDPSYKTIRGILAAGTETQLLAAPAPGSGAGAFLRGPGQIFGNVLPFPATATGAVADPGAMAPAGEIGGGDGTGVPS